MTKRERLPAAVPARTAIYDQRVLRALRFEPSDIDAMIEAVGLPLAPGISKQQVADLLREAFRRAGPFYGHGETTPHVNEVRAHLDRIENAARELLLALGCESADRVPGRGELRNKLHWLLPDVDAVAALATLPGQDFESLEWWSQAAALVPVPSGPPEAWEHPRRRPAEVVEAALLAAPATIAAIQLVAAGARRYVESDPGPFSVRRNGSGPPPDYLLRVLNDRLLDVHQAMFGRQPNLRNRTGDRGGPATRWLLAVTAALCRRLPEDAESDPLGRRLLAITESSPATLATHLEEARARRKPRKSATSGS